MSTMQWLTGSAAQAIGWALLHLLWQATIVAGILAAALALIPRRNADLRYGVACGALALVFAMFVGTAIRAYDPAAAPIATSSISPDGDSVSISLAKVPIVIVLTAAEGWRDRAIDLVTRARQSLPSVVALWFLGVVILSTRLLVSWRRTHTLVHRDVSEAGPEWQDVAVSLSRKLGLTRAVRLLESAAVEVPSVLGTLRPVILLPASTLTGLTPEQIEMVLAHELAHIRRHDFAINLLQAFVETLMFYHPAVWWMSGRVRIERENCCDDLAVSVCGNPLQYARTLTRLEELRATALPMVVAANGGSLLHRIRRIAGGRPESTGASSRWAAAVAMLAILGAALAVPSMPLLAQREQAKPTPRAETSIDVVERAPSIDADPDDDADGVDVDDESDHGWDADGERIEINPEVHVAPMADLDLDFDHDHDFDFDQDFDFDFDFDRDLQVPAVAPVAPVPPVALMPGFTPNAPRAPRAVGVPSPVAAPAPPAPPRGLAALGSFGFPFDGDDDIDDDHDRDGDDEGDDDEKHLDRKLSAAGKLTVDELIALRAVGADPKYINEMKAIFPELTIREVTSLRAVGVTAAYVQEMRAAGFTADRARDITSLRAVGVTPEFAREIRAAGLKAETTQEITSLRAVGVTPEFIKEMRAAGFAALTAKEATSLRAVGVTPEFAREMRALGFKADRASDITSLRAVGVTAEFTRAMRDLGFKVETAKEIISLRAAGVTPEFVRALRAAGVTMTTARDATQLRAMNVTPEFVRKLAAAGYTALSVRELSRLAAHGVDDDFIRDMEQYRIGKDKPKNP